MLPLISVEGDRDVRVVKIDGLAGYATIPVQRIRLYFRSCVLGKSFFLTMSEASELARELHLVVGGLEQAGWSDEGHRAPVQLQSVSGEENGR